MSREAEVIADAVARGDARLAIHDKHREAMFPHMAVLLREFGPDALRAIAASAAEIVIRADQRARVGAAEVVPFPEDRR